MCSFLPKPFIDLCAPKRLIALGYKKRAKSSLDNARMSFLMEFISSEITVKIKKASVMRLSMGF